MMFYIMHSISQNQGLNKMSGGADMKSMLGFGNWIIAIFSSIFLFYTNSFLIKRRKKEFGLYNILGMEKRHILKMLSLETGIVFLVSLILGLIGGILFSKLMFLLLLKLLQFSVPLGFSVSWSSVFYTCLLFAAIFFVTLLFNLGQIHIAKPIELLKGGQQGEKEPKTKWFLAIVGILLLGAGYVMSITVQNPLSALVEFFVAVIFVILGTYALFTAGSIALLKMLRKKKNYYYQPKHFTNVSGMIYRMKQNAVGLANICILSTIVLVTLSTTVCLYGGEDDILKGRFPREVQISMSNLSDEDDQSFNSFIEQQAKQLSCPADNFLSYRSAGFAALKKGNTFTADTSQHMSSDDCAILVITADQYNRLEGTSVSLNDNDVLTYSKKDINGDINLYGKPYHIVEKLKEFKLKDMDSEVVDTYYFVVKNEAAVQDIISSLPTDQQKTCFLASNVGFDLSGSRSDIVHATDQFSSIVQSKYADAEIDSREESRQSFLSVYGGMFFLGIFFGVLFLMATVLIIYYKQVSEGFEDKERYEIMQKVGMSQKEVKKSIHSQILMVFFLPLAAAIIHIAFAFPMITKLLVLFNMKNVFLFLGCTAGVILVFACVYTLVFLMTAKSYYRIVRAN